MFKVSLLRWPSSHDRELTLCKWKSGLCCDIDRPNLRQFTSKGASTVLHLREQRLTRPSPIMAKSSLSQVMKTPTLYQSRNSKNPWA